MSPGSSRTSSVACGLLGAALVALAMSGDGGGGAFVGAGWLRCRESAVVGGAGRDGAIGGRMTSVQYRIGLWRVCPVNSNYLLGHRDEEADEAEEIYVFKNLECLSIPYNYWNIEHLSHDEIWSSLQFMPQFVSKMRVCTPFTGSGLVCMCVATLCSICNAMLLACGFFILAGILIGSGLLMFASILSDAYYDGSSATVDYGYGPAFFFAAGALAMAQLAVVFSVTSYMYKFGSAEDMVRAMVPGADRRLRQQRRHRRRDRPAAGDSCSSSPSPLATAGAALSAAAAAEYDAAALAAAAAFATGGDGRYGDAAGDGPSPRRSAGPAPAAGTLGTAPPPPASPPPPPIAYADGGIGGIGGAPLPPPSSAAERRRRPDLCEAADDAVLLMSGGAAAGRRRQMQMLQQIQQQQQQHHLQQLSSNNRFKTLGPRYAAPPRPPPQFCTLPRRPAAAQQIGGVEAPMISVVPDLQQQQQQQMQQQDLPMPPPPDFCGKSQV